MNYKSIVMYCKECGKEIANDSKFCNHCGAKQDSSISDKKETGKKIVLEVPEVIVRNKLSKGTKIFISLYVIYLFIILLICINEGKMYDEEVTFAIFAAAFPALVVLVRYIYKQIKSK